MNCPAERAKSARPGVLGGGARPDKRPDRGTRARFSGGLAVVTAKARVRMRCVGTVQAHRRRAGGPTWRAPPGNSSSCGHLNGPAGTLATAPCRGGPNTNRIRPARTSLRG